MINLLNIVIKNNNYSTIVNIPLKFEDTPKIAKCRKNINTLIKENKKDFSMEFINFIKDNIKYETLHMEYTNINSMDINASSLFNSSNTINLSSKFNRPSFHKGPGVYAIIQNDIDCYIGSAVNIANRMYAHYYSCMKQKPVIISPMHKVVAIFRRKIVLEV